VRPTLPGRSLAPITATLRGAKKTRRGWRTSARSRFEEASPLISRATDER